jgi:hypothetical protein
MTAPKLTIGQLSFDISAGDNLAQAAPFTPLAVMVDNYSPYYLLLPDAGTYVPPWTTGAILPLIHASICQATWANPASTAIATIPYVAAAGFAHLRFLDTALPSSAGTPLSQTGLTNGVSFSAAVGNSITITPSVLSFLAVGLRIDNPSGTSYQIVETSQVIPMFTSGWTIDIDPPFNTLTIVPYQIPGTQLNATIGGPITAFLYPYNIGQNGGTTIPTTNIPYRVEAHGNSTVGTSFSLNLTSPALQDDIIILSFSVSSANAITAPANAILHTSYIGATYIQYVYYCVATGGEQTFTFSASLMAWFGVICNYRNTQGRTGTLDTAATSKFAALTITPITSPAIIFCTFTNDFSGASYTPWPNLKTAFVQTRATATAFVIVSDIIVNSSTGYSTGAGVSPAGITAEEIGFGIA